MSRSSDSLLLALPLLLAAAAALPAAPMPPDVPRSHWAYAAIEELARVGLVPSGPFQGDKPVSRFDMAVRVAEMLGARSTAPGDVVADAAPRAEALGTEFAAELGALGVRVSGMESERERLADELSGLKAGSGASRWVSPRWGLHGLLAVSLVRLDEFLTGTFPPPPGAVFPTTPRTRYLMFPFVRDTELFTLPQSSLALDAKIGDRTSVYMLWDFGTDLNSSFLLGPVGFNQIYLDFERLIDDVSLRVGGLALPFVDWDYRGPLWSVDDTITPSAMSSFLEFYRSLGIELRGSRGERARDLRWRLGLFTGGELGTGGGFAGNFLLGFMTEVWSLQDVAFQPIFDDTFGWYLDLRGGEVPTTRWGWRAGWWDLGGDPDGEPAGPGVTGHPASSDLEGPILGLSHRAGRFELYSQAMFLNQTDALGPKTGLDSWYLRATWQAGPRTRVTLRHDDWGQDFLQPGLPNPSFRINGRAFTAALSRAISPGSMLQLEWVSPQEEQSGTAIPDAEDDQLQVRYKVWF